MKIEVEIPEPRFKVNDIVYLPNKHNKFGWYLKILGYDVEYSPIKLTHLGLEPFVLTYGSYTLQIMLGSIFDSELQALDKGKAPFGYLCLETTEIDTRCMYIGTGSTYILFGLDTSTAIINKLELLAIETLKLKEFTDET